VHRPLHTTSLPAVILCCACCALLFAACGRTADQSSAGAAGSNSTPGSSAAVTAVFTAPSARNTPTSAATLRCTMREEPVTTDTVSVILACTVANASGSDTSFTASYYSKSLKGQGHSADAMCQGSLRNGGGTCTATFILAALNAAPGSVTGELLPSHLALGPVTPARGS
jgi:hypothetical protein